MAILSKAKNSDDNSNVKLSNNSSESKSLCKYFFSADILLPVSFILYIVCFYMIRALNSYSKEDAVAIYPIVGAVIGFFSSFYVIIEYIRDPSARKPPLSLLFWRAVADLGISLRFIIVPLINYLNRGNIWSSTLIVSDSLHGNPGQLFCGPSSAIFEFFEIASEAWFCCIALDLYFSINSPFSSFKSREKWYHIFTWSVAIIFAIPTGLDSNIYGYWFINKKISSNAVCWIKSLRAPGAAFNWRPWVLFFFPMIIIYCFCIFVLVFAYNRLKKGISITMLHRLRVLVLNFINIFVCLTYWFFLGSFYSLSYAVESRPVFAVVLYAIGSKGYSSIVVWLLSQNVQKIFKTSDDDERVDLNTALRQEIMYFATKGIRDCAKTAATTDLTNKKFIVGHMGHNKESEKDNKSEYFSMKFFFFIMIGRTHEIKVLLNNKKEIGKKETEQYIRMSLADTNGNTEDILQELRELSTINLTDEELRLSQRFTEISNNMTSYPRHSIMSIVEDEVEEEKTNLFSYYSSKFWNFFTGEDNNVVQFTEFQPHHFRRIRLSAGVDDDKYISAFRTSVKERVTNGGASGAFFFFSEGELFIAKSSTEEEITTLTNNAAAYADYLCAEENRDSYISKIYGAYQLQVYGTYLPFFVMNNIFLTKNNLMIHEKYDIKGSWIKRNADLPKEGDMATCRLCEQKFRFTRKSTNRRNQYRLEELKSNDKKGSKSNSKNFLNDLEKGTNPMLSLEMLNKVNLDSDRDSDVSENEGSTSRNTSTSNSASSTYSNTSGEGYDKCFRTSDGNHEPMVIMKDNDLKYKLNVSESAALHLQKQLKKDAYFLCNHLGVMDYSLLVGVSKKDYVFEDKDNENDSEKDKNVVIASKLFGPQAYLVGIIDYQQTWNWNKKMERFIKINFRGADPEGLSAIEPQRYYERFIEKIEDILEVETRVIIPPKISPATSPINNDYKQDDEGITTTFVTRAKSSIL